MLTDAYEALIGCVVFIACVGGFIGGMHWAFTDGRKPSEPQS